MGLIVQQLLFLEIGSLQKNKKIFLICKSRKSTEIIFSAEMLNTDMK